jgi:hypothetical protein
VLATVSIFGQAAGFLGVLIYQRYMREVSIRVMLLGSTVICCFLSLLGILLYTKVWG